MRKPPLTHRAIMRLLAVRSMAMADADSMHSNKPDQEHAKELYEGCEYIEKLAAWWAHSHGVDWPTEYTTPPGQEKRMEIESIEITPYSPRDHPKIERDIDWLLANPMKSMGSSYHDAGSCWLLIEGMRLRLAALNIACKVTSTL